jgi:hypothetical protein
LKKILYQSGGGLGDWLINSTLPELFYKQGYKVYISSRGVEEFKTKDTLDLLLQCPYIEGVSDDPHNIGSENLPNVNTYLNIHNDDVTLVRAREVIYGFEWRNLKPIIYYHPNFRVEFSDKVVCDFNAFSTNSLYSHEKIHQFILNNKDYIYLNLKGGFSNNEIYNTKDIFEYIDIIYSCKKFKCMMSGGGTLAPAISRFRSNLEIDCYMPDEFDMSNVMRWLFKFPDVNYNNYF